MHGSTPGGRTTRGGVDPSLIMEGSRKRSRVLPSPEPQSQASLLYLCRVGTRSRWSSGWAYTVANEPSEFLDVRKRGLALYDKICSHHDPYQPTRPIHLDFMRLPSRTDYPDYYEIIKKPIDLTIIKDRLEKLEYRSVLEIKDDFNQLFVNAKRYNAPGSSIFLDARALHRVLKDAFASWTGEAMPTDDDDADGDKTSEPHNISSNSYRPSPLASSSSTPSGAGGARRGPTLRPWLKRKFDELIGDVDPLGRRYADSFWTLPDRKEWVDYYKLVASPIAFEQIRHKIEKRIYTNVAAFIHDVDLLVNNALISNEEGSSIWKDAKYLQLKFLEVMKEQPPEFVPPRTYNTQKRRKEAELRAKGLSHSSSSTSINGFKDGRGRGMSAGQGVSGSEPPEGIEDDAPSEDDDRDEEGDRALPPGEGMTPIHYGRPPGPLPVPMPTSVSLPSAAPYPAAPAPASAGSPFPSAAVSVESPAAMVNSAFGSPMPFNGNGVLPALPVVMSGVSVFSVVPTSGSSVDRMVAKVNGSEKSSPLSYLLLRPLNSTNPAGTSSTANTPSIQPLLLLPTLTVRQHFLPLPIDTERVEITPVLSCDSSGNVPMRVFVRGTGTELRCEEIPMTPTANTKGNKAGSAIPGASATEGRRSWNIVLGPRIAEAYGVGIGVVEVVVGGDGEGKKGDGEVYRCFLRR
ncbi:BZ3500_MvSof-1268-A1-R1_Chr6-2g08434 [Microbotryum saponariae]|uniref:BZ3500_MvSof-1268-A1-R1_Chr6-2g08434 protein n=1 Tax=Microbotryum saponariae TaxID=289078 RepID=A0A2X0LKQ1_9BASI|nr:BZ3500_MvSof-1268-A1-R1_Chr6-2g08434 [Microbotryum saponariae]SDA07711.1 BZ3501_MvSof-1269-A2-R1_Chr6-1g08148 [Microbotryum saponariae]